MLSVHATDGVQVLLAGFLDKSSKAFPKQQAEISGNGSQTPRPGEPKGLGLWPCYSTASLMGAPPPPPPFHSDPPHYSTSWTLCRFRYGGIVPRYLRSPFDTACINANFLGTKSSEFGFCNFRCFRKADFFVSSDLECFSVCIDTVRISNNVRLQDSISWQSNFLS